MWVPHCKLTDPTSFEIKVWSDLLDKIRSNEDLFSYVGTSS